MTPLAPIRHRIGVLGAGSMAQEHLAAWQRLGVEAVVHSPSGRGRALAQSFGAEAADSLPELLRVCDVVDICTPTDTHLHLARAAFAAGRAVICEKPLARTHEDAVAILDSAQSAGVGLQIAHVVRYFQAYALARDAVLRGEIGAVVEIHLHRTGGAPASAWFHDEARSGGVLMDQMIHDFDFARWIAGEAVSVEAQVRPGAAEALPGIPITRASARLEHRSGVESHLTGGWLEPDAPFTTKLRIVGKSGEIRHTNADNRLVCAPASGAGWTVDTAADRPYDAQLAEFVLALDGGPAPRIGPADALAAVDLTLAAIESAHAGTVVHPRAIG